MVYQRDQVNKTFKPKPYFELNAEILANQQKFVAKLDPYQRFKNETGLMIFMKAKHVQKGSQDGLIKDVQKQAKKRASPQLFSLSSLQSAMSKRYHASASQTLAAIQSLYEAKLLSYPRTDCAYITDEEFEYLVANLTKYLGLVSKQVALTNITPNKRYVNGKKVEEHYAIIMTKVVPTKEKLASLPKLQQQVYDLVLRTTLAMFADPYEYEETTIITQVGDANFKATGKVPTKQGWQALFDETKTEQQETATLPLVHQGDQVKALTKVNLIQSRRFGDMLENNIEALNQRGVTTEIVIRKLIELAKNMQETEAAGESLGLSANEQAFYDALCDQKTAVQVMGEDTLQEIAKELVGTVRKYAATPDWVQRKTTQAAMRQAVRRMLKDHGYPPTFAPVAVDTIVEQAQTMAFENNY